MRKPENLYNQETTCYLGKSQVNVVYDYIYGKVYILSINDMDAKLFIGGTVKICTAQIKHYEEVEKWEIIERENNIALYHGGQL